MTPLQLDRWLLNNVFARSRVRTVALSDCIDEFGYRFGPAGDHFFVRALADSNDRPGLIDYLRRHYATDDIYRRADELGLGDVYFCPWEAGRVRPLAKFATSHKVGPTPDAALGAIADRLVATVDKLRRDGYHPRRQCDGISHGYVLVDDAGHRRFVIRDGQHRAAALTHLGHQTMLFCTEADHWTPSVAYRALSRLRGQQHGNPSVLLAEVRVTECSRWPHVADGRLTPDQARRFFARIFA